MVQQSLHNEGVNSNIIPPHLSIERDKDLFPRGLDKGYVLSKRRSAYNLICDYASSVRKCQDDYMAHMEEAKSTLIQNVAGAMYMDSFMNTVDCTDCEDSSTSDEEQDKPLKDGSLRYRCPVIGCHSQSFRLERHLKTVHNGLEQDGRDVAVNFARIMRRNKKRPKRLNNTHQSHLKKTSRSKTALINRKLNLKKCCLCEGLVKNISQHINLVHKIERCESRFAQLIDDSPTVPQCYTKKKWKISHAHWK